MVNERRIAAWIAAAVAAGCLAVAAIFAGWSALAWGICQAFAEPSGFVACMAALL